MVREIRTNERFSAIFQIFGWSVATIYCAIALYVMIDAGEPEALSWWFLFVPFALWAVAPVVYLAKLLVKRSNDYRRWPISIVLGAISTFSVYIYYDLFYVHLDALNGVAFIFFPMLFWVLIGALTASLAVFDRRAHRLSK